MEELKVFKLATLALNLLSTDWENSPIVPAIPCTKTPFEPLIDIIPVLLSTNT